MLQIWVSWLIQEGSKKRKEEKDAEKNEIEGEHGLLQALAPGDWTDHKLR
jgi:hypothetical protein